MLITCLGVSGSGKTVFLGSLLDCLYSPAKAQDGFFISDTSASGGRILSDTLNYKNIGLMPRLDKVGINGFRGYPDNTSGTVFRTFSLIHGRDSVLEIGWLDYKGGLLTGEVEDIDSQNALYEALSQSTAIVVYLDAFQIASASSIPQAQMRVGIDPISRIFAHFESSKQHRNVNILVVLTQCDAVDEKRWGGNGNYAPLKERARQVLGGICDVIGRNSLWHCGMVTVSAVGQGRNRRTIKTEARFNKPAVIVDEIIDIPQPMNIVEAFFWLVACEVSVRRQSALGRISDLKQNRDEASVQIRRGAESERNRVQLLEDRRLADLGFLRRLLELTIMDSDRKAKLHAQQSAAERNFVASRQHITDGIDSNILGEKDLLSKYESALGPLFSRANRAVTKPC
jgi:hypothetical protein